ncbi:hypothetical protein FRC17_009063 [Serendipita sp. 399]|nr:hypothetical protein FRC17_009063 [Serendipita sp. 399]
MQYRVLIATLVSVMTLSLAAPIVFEVVAPPSVTVEEVTIKDPFMPEIVIQESHISNIVRHADVAKRSGLESRSLELELNALLQRELNVPPKLTGPDFGRMPKEEFLQHIYGMLPRIELPPVREVVITEVQL